MACFDVLHKKERVSTTLALSKTNRQNETKNPPSAGLYILIFFSAAEYSS